MSCARRKSQRRSFQHKRSSTSLSMSDLSQPPASQSSEIDTPRAVKTRRPWSSSEDKALRSLVSQYGDSRGSQGGWKEISCGLPGRTSKDCRKRWFHSLDPSLRKGRWTNKEDTILLEAYSRLGPAWHDIALLIPGRKDDQCSKRYNDILNPSAENRLRGWSEEEDRALRESVETLGHRWSVISARFTSRPPLTCRNRWRHLSRHARGTGSDSDPSPGLSSDASRLPQNGEGSIDTQPRSGPASTGARNPTNLSEPNSYGNEEALDGTEAMDPDSVFPNSIAVCPEELMTLEQATFDSMDALEENFVSPADASFSQSSLPSGWDTSSIFETINCAPSPGDCTSMMTEFSHQFPLQNRRQIGSRPRGNTRQTDAIPFGYSEMGLASGVPNFGQGPKVDQPLVQARYQPSDLTNTSTSTTTRVEHDHRNNTHIHYHHHHEHHYHHHYHHHYN